MYSLHIRKKTIKFISFANNNIDVKSHVKISDLMMF